MATPGLKRVQVDPYIIAVALLGFWLFAPLIAAGLPQAPDAFLHFYRAVAWRFAIGQNVWWPRWDTLLYQGYGYPLFNFYAPLLYIATALLTFVIPSIEGAFKAVLLLACLAYPFGMYLWARDILGRAGALVAAAAYTFAAYRFRELYFLGGYSQFVAWALYPWILYFCQRLAVRRSPFYFSALALSLAALVMAHNIGAMLFGPVLLAYAGYLLISNRKTGLWKPLLLAGLCAAGISAVFWLPALGEVRYVRVTNLTQGIWDVANNFLRLSDLYASAPPLDDRAVNPILPFTFGRLTLVLALVGALTLLRPLKREQRVHTAFSLVGLGVTVFMMLPPSLPVWRAIPGLKLTEYPWRVFGPALLFSSWLAGASLLWLEGRPRLRAVAALAGVVALILAVGVYQFPRPLLPAPARPEAYLIYEKAFRTMGTTAASEYLPNWVSSTPDEPALTRDLNRQALATPLPGQAGKVLGAGPQSLHLQVELADPGPVTFAQFYFPGWQATVDGQPAPVGMAPGSGLIQLALPGGQHDVQLTFMDTPVRRAGMICSIVALLAMAGIAWLLGRRLATEPPYETEVVPLGKGRSPALWPEGLALGGVLALLLALGVLWVGPHTSLFRLASPPGQAIQATRQTDLPVGDKVRLLGYDLAGPQVEQGSELRVRLFWQALEPLGRDYSSYVQLLAENGVVSAGQSDHQHPGNIPTDTWTPDRYVVDEHIVRVPAGAPPVPVTLEAGLYDRSTGERLGSAELPQRVYIEPQPSVDLDQIDRTSATRFDSAIRLLGHRIKRQGDALELTLFWQADGQPAADYQVFVHVVDGAGQMVVQSDSAPVEGLYPTSMWRSGDIIADVHRISLPARVSPATVQIGLYQLSTLQRLAARSADGTQRDDGVVTIHVN